MKETIKEKRIRFILIGFFILLIISAFIYRLDKQQVKVREYDPLALVLRQSTSKEDNPVVGLYEYKNSQHILAIYEIERTNRFKFNTKHAIELKDFPKQLSPDKSGKGLWSNCNGEWIYFTQSLQEEYRDPKWKITDSPFEASLNFDENQSPIKVNDNQSITLEKGEKPIGLHSLSEDGSLWLVVTKKGTKIAAIETK